MICGFDAQLIRVTWKRKYFVALIADAQLNTCTNWVRSDKFKVSKHTISYNGIFCSTNKWHQCQTASAGHWIKRFKGLTGSTSFSIEQCDGKIWIKLNFLSWNLDPPGVRATTCLCLTQSLWVSEECCGISFTCRTSAAFCDLSAAGKVTQLVRGFNSDWKKAIELINHDVMTSFTNFKNGTQIMQVRCVFGWNIRLAKREYFTLLQLVSLVSLSAVPPRLQ